MTSQTAHHSSEAQRTLQWFMTLSLLAGIVCDGLASIQPAWVLPFVNPAWLYGLGLLFAVALTSQSNNRLEISTLTRKFYWLVLIGSVVITATLTWGPVVQKYSSLIAWVIAAGIAAVILRALPRSDSE